MNLRLLNVCDKDKLEELIKITEESLSNKYFWLPINETSRSHFFDSNWTEFYGVFDEEKLIGAAGLFYNKHEYGESAEVAGLSKCNIVGFGRAMVHPNYRNKGIIGLIINKLLEVAKEKGKEYAILTVHPENTASKRAVMSKGFVSTCSIIKYKCYERDVFIKRL